MMKLDDIEIGMELYVPKLGSTGIVVWKDTPPFTFERDVQLEFPNKSKAMFFLSEVHSVASASDCFKVIETQHPDELFDGVPVVMKILKTINHSDSNFIHPRVVLVSTYDERIHAWNSSRPSLDPVNNLLDIEKVDLTLNELKMYTFNITSSVLLRELFTSIRPIHVWSSTSRNTNLKLLRIMSEYEHSSYHDISIGLLDKVINSTSHQDSARLDLPISHETTYTIMINHRTLISFLKTMKKLSSTLFNVYGELFLLSINISTLELDGYPYGTLEDSVKLNDEESLMDESSVVLAGMSVTKTTIGVGLLAQMVRHSQNRVKTSLWNLIETTPDFRDIQLSLNSTIPVMLYIPTNSYRGMVSHRSGCNVADPLMWDGFNKSATKDMSASDYRDIMPCKCDHTKCPFKKDMMGRVLKKDPGPVCPIFIEDPSSIDRMESIYGSDNTTVINFNKLIKSQMISDNPSNENRLIYENTD